MIKLPKPKTKGGQVLNSVFYHRRSKRNYSIEPITLNDLSQLLWSGQGTTNSQGLRTTPSAGGLYPIEIMVAVNQLTGINSGLFMYRPQNHALIPLLPENLTQNICKASLLQPSIEHAAVILVLIGFFEVPEKKYGNRAKRYVYIEAGHIAQNILLQATSLGLGAVPIGAFEDEPIKAICKTVAAPLYMIPIGKPC